MAPLLPSESAAYSLSLPDDTEDDRLNLKLRTGAATTYTRSTVVVHGGLTLGLGLPKITIAEIEKQLREQLGVKSWDKYLSNEFFYLSIINRKWNRVVLGPDGLKPKPRFFHSLTYIRNSLYIFGGLTLDDGKNKLIPVNDLWEFNIGTNVWTCLDDGSDSGTVSRYDHSLLHVDYISPEDQEVRSGLAITGGRGELNQELMHITVFDIASKEYLNNTEMQLTLNETKQVENQSGRGVKEARAKLKVTSGSSFVISGTSTSDNDNISNEKDDILYVFSQDGITDETLKNPIVSLPVAPNSSGVRLPLSSSTSKNKTVVPRCLKNPTGDLFGTNIIVSGHSIELNEYQVYLFNRPSQKWTRLSIDNKLKAKDMYLWKSFSWHSHHKVIVLGSTVFPKDPECATIQKFDLLVLVGLPITNIFHAFSASKTNLSVDGKNTAPKMSIKETMSFEAYSKYIAPTSKISSIRSVFPSYAVTLGRNAFERYGASLADFEFITADGDKINVPLMLLRKRWGRCFDMLLAKGYARAVFKLESAKDEEEEEVESKSVLSGNQQSKKSMMMLSKASHQAERASIEAPQFRLPFQDKSAPLTTTISAGTSGPSPSLPTSRKASIVSTGGLSVTSTSTNDLPDGPDLSALPPATSQPTDPLPALEMKQSHLKSVNSRDLLRDSPRGSVSGASMALSTHSNTGNNASPNTGSALKLKDLRSPVNHLKKRSGTSRSSSVQNGTPGCDDSSVNETGSNLDSLHTESFDESKNLLEPLLIPRSLYLPFATSTVQAIAEFLFVGKLGDRWLLSPTTTDTFLVAKFYELPLLYDLISEVLYAILGKKEDAMMKSYGNLVQEYEKRLKIIFNNDQDKVNGFLSEHPHINDTFTEIENYLATVDDGFLNLALLRRAGKGSSYSSTVASTKTSVDLSRKQSLKSNRLTKSSLSKEVKPDDDAAGDDIDNEIEDADEEDNPKPFEPIARAASSEPIKFRTDSMSLTSPRKALKSDDDDVDPITTLNKTGDENAISDEDPLSSTRADESNDPKVSHPRGAIPHSKKTESESDNGFLVPEGNFRLEKAKDHTVIEARLDNDPEEKKETTTTTSDSDELAVGLGLVSNLQTKQKKKSSVMDRNNDQEFANEDGDDLTGDNNLPTLENLASPNSPEPADHIIQVVYEAAALACDMKLLLRAVNALEMSKVLNSKKEELFKELDDIASKFGEEKLAKEVTEKKEKDDEERAKKDVDQKAVAELQTKPLSLDAANIRALQSELGEPMQNPFRPVVQNKSAPSNKPHVASSSAGSSLSSVTSPQKTVRSAASSISMNQRASVAGEASDISSIASRKSGGFLRSFSTLNLSSRKHSSATTLTNPMPSSRAPSSSSERKPHIFGLLSRKSSKK